ncbi:MAG: glycoside hydrolase family 57 [Alphaproteobacteria bacterium]
MLRVHAFFHLNLMFSSIEERQRPEVIRRCYWPLLRMAEHLGRPIGIEATGFTLETIETLDAAWLQKCRELVVKRLIEPIGSGYTQMIGPLMPAELVRWNLKLGHQTYERLWGRRPRLALINEQAYSAGILAHYVDAGYDAVLMDWDMCSHAHPEWPDEWRYHPQRVEGVGASLPVIWTSTLTFQRLQRLAHGELDLREYLEGILARAGDHPRTLAIYSNDAECFDFRPGRFKTEAAIAGSVSEWGLIETAFDCLARDDRVTWIAPHEALVVNGSAPANHPVRLESAAFPIPVKKQLKYNASRWAVTGRASFDLNRRCRAAARQLTETGTQDEQEWRKLCWLAASDVRTHITEARFAEALSEFDVYESRLMARTPNVHPLPAGKNARDLAVESDERHIALRGGALEAGLNPRRGLAIDRLRVGGRDLAGTVPHGTFDDLTYAFDWYSGTLIAELIGRPKITDLLPVLPDIAVKGDRIVLRASLATPLGTLEKTLEYDAEGLACRYVLDWPATDIGTLRIANLTLLPDAIEPQTLYYETNNGGAAERFPLYDQTIDHGAPVSFLVSASSGAAMTEGWIRIGDARGALRISAEPESDAFLALVTHRSVKGKIFCRVTLSAAELDDTRKPWAAAPRPLRLGYRITAG